MGNQYKSNLDLFENSVRRKTGHMDEDEKFSAKTPSTSVKVLIQDLKVVNERVWISAYQFSEILDSEDFYARHKTTIFTMEYCSYFMKFLIETETK